MKRKLSLILVICLLMTGVGVRPIQAEAETLLLASANLIQQGAIVGTKGWTGESKQIRSTRTTKTAKEVLLEGLQSMTPSIELTSYALTMDELVDLVGDIVNETPELFYIGSKVRAYENADEIITSFLPEYLYSADQVTEMQKKLDEAVALLLSEIKDTWSDREKALYVHDYLISQFTYDTTYTKYDMYSLLVDGTAVCQGYTLAYNYIMNLLGIPCVAVPSDTMGHIWNQIQLDGKWYHVDLTYDDPIPDIAGAARHNNFLLSDTRISTQTNNEHEDWESDYTCTDTTYDNYFWTNSHAPFVYAGSTWYYVNSVVGNTAGIYQWDPTTDTATRVIDLSAKKWTTDSGAYYTKLYTGLAAYNGNVYYNTADEIFSFTEETHITSNSLSVQITPGNKIWGIQIKNYQLMYSQGTGYSAITETSTVLTFERPQVTACPTETPIVSAKPEETGTPTASVKPEETTTTTASAKPEETVAPTASAKPEETGTPTVSAKPEETDTPIVSAKPEETDTPIVSAKPEETDTPIVSAKPEETDTPIVSAKPEETATPIVSAKPEETNVPVSGIRAEGSRSTGVTVEQGESSASGNTTSVGKDQIRITAKKGKKKIVIRVPKKVTTIVRLNKKIIRMKKRRLKKYKVLAKKNKTGKITILLSKKLRKGMQIRVTIKTGKEKVRCKQQIT